MSVRCQLSKKNPTITDSVIWQHACELFFHVYVKIRLISLTAQARTHARTHTHTVTHTQMSGQ